MGDNRYRAKPTSEACAEVIRMAKRLSVDELERLKEWCANSIWSRRYGTPDRRARSVEKEA